jgi:sugar lactone lactonase YvrE
MFEIERLNVSENEVGESPRWDSDEQAVYWLDIWSEPTLHPETGAFQKWETGLHMTGQARRQGGGFVFATRAGLRRSVGHTYRYSRAARTKIRRLNLPKQPDYMPNGAEPKTRIRSGSSRGILPDVPDLSPK